MPNFIDRTGQTFGRLIVLSRAENIGKLTAWLCRCDCGNETVVQSGHLQQGRIVSCGCYKVESAMVRSTSHGHWGTKLHRVWLSMRQRCNNPRCKDYANYGARGIKVCSEWNSFQAFEQWAISSGYRQGLSIDRRDNDGNYEPSNCRWVDIIAQATNRRVTRFVDSPLGRLPLSELSRRSGINYGTLLSRVQSGAPAEHLLDPVNF